MKTSSKVLCDLIALVKLTSSVSIECVRQGLPWWLSGKESAYQCRILGFNPWAGKILWRRKWQPIPVFLPGKSHGQRSLSCCSPWGSPKVKYNLATKQQQYVRQDPASGPLYLLYSLSRMLFSNIYKWLPSFLLVFIYMSPEWNLPWLFFLKFQHTNTSYFPSLLCFSS